MNTKEAVIVFVKYPQQGKVKTRLAADTGEKFAVEFYLETCNNIFHELYLLNQNGTDVFLYYTGADQYAMKNWVRQDFFYVEQNGIDLGEKMKNAFSEVFGKGYESVLIIGTDIPDFDAAYIQNAFTKLKKYNFVITPAGDGGYCLMGKQKQLDTLFEGIEWSTDTVCDDTIEKAKEAGLDVKILPVLFDVDTGYSLHYWLKKEGGNEELKRKFRELLKTSK